MKENVLILFTRVPVPGKTKTRLMPFLKEEECAKLHEAFLHDLREKAEKINGDLIVFYTPEDQAKALQDIVGTSVPCLPQYGEDLGARMRNAIAITFLLGYKRSVLIGSDCPQIHVESMNQAFESLDEKDIVIHPTMDGGYYLIGMTENHDSIWNIERYGTNTVIYDTLEFMKKEHLSIAIGQMYYDIDDKDDLYHLYRDLKSEIITNCPSTASYITTDLQEKLEEYGKTKKENQDD